MRASRCHRSRGAAVTGCGDPEWDNHENISAKPKRARSSAAVKRRIAGEAIAARDALSVGAPDTGPGWPGRHR
jgi:hypothetical protein